MGRLVPLRSGRLVDPMQHYRIRRAPGETGPATPKYHSNSFCHKMLRLPKCQRRTVGGRQTGVGPQNNRKPTFKFSGTKVDLTHVNPIRTFGSTRTVSRADTAKDPVRRSKRTDALVGTERSRVCDPGLDGLGSRVESRRARGSRDRDCRSWCPEPRDGWSRGVEEGAPRAVELGRDAPRVGPGSQRRS